MPVVFIDAYEAIDNLPIVVLPEFRQFFPNNPSGWLIWLGRKLDYPPQANVKL